MSEPSTSVARLAYSQHELATALGVSDRLIKDQVAAGRIRSVLVGRRRLIPAVVADELLNGSQP